MYAFTYLAIWAKTMLKSSCAKGCGRRGNQVNCVSLQAGGRCYCCTCVGAAHWEVVHRHPRLCQALQEAHSGGEGRVVTAAESGAGQQKE